MIHYTYNEPNDVTEITFKSAEEFFANQRGKMFKELLSASRLAVTKKIVITTRYPATITIEIEGE